MSDIQVKGCQYEISVMEKAQLMLSELNPFWIWRFSVIYRLSSRLMNSWFPFQYTAYMAIIRKRQTRTSLRMCKRLHSAVFLLKGIDLSQSFHIHTLRACVQTLRQSIWPFIGYICAGLIAFIDAFRICKYWNVCFFYLGFTTRDLIIILNLLYSCSSGCPRTSPAAR